MAEHASEMNGYLIQTLGLTPLECDEICSFVKKQKNIELGSPNWTEEGDAWIYTCVKRSTYFFVAFSVGKRTQKSCRRMMKKVFGRTEQPSPQTEMEMFTDGNDDYTYVLPPNFE